MNTILDFKSDFDGPMCELLPILLACDDGCPNAIVKWCMRQMIVVRLMCHAKATVCCVYQCCIE